MCIPITNLRSLKAEMREVQVNEKQCQTLDKLPVAVPTVRIAQWSSSSPLAPWFLGKTSSSSLGPSCSCPDVLVSATEGIKVKDCYYKGEINWNQGYYTQRDKNWAQILCSQAGLKFTADG